MEIKEARQLKLLDRVFSKLRHFLVVTSSVILIIIGIIGIILPVMPGIPFLILGFMLWYEEDARQIKVRLINIKTKVIAIILKKYSKKKSI